MAAQKIIIQNPNLSFHLEIKNNGIEQAICNTCGYWLFSLSRTNSNFQLRDLLYLLDQVKEHTCYKGDIKKYAKRKARIYPPHL